MSEPQSSKTELSILPTNFRRFEGYYWYAVLLAARESVANAVGYQATKGEPEVKIWFLRRDADRAVYLLVGHNGNPFKSRETLQKKGLAPFQSERVNRALNGAGLGFAAAMLRSAAELVIASRIDGEWVSAVAYADHADSRWNSYFDPDWIKVLKDSIGDRQVKAMNVFYAFRLEDAKVTGSTAPIKEQHLNLLTFMCPSFIGKGRGHRWSPEGSVKINVDTTIVSKDRPYEAGSSGSARRPVVPMAEFYESYADGIFNIPVDPFIFEIDPIENTKVRIHMLLQAIAYPTE